MRERFRRIVPTAIRRNYALKFMLTMLVLGSIVGTGVYAGTGLIAAETEEQTYERQAEFAKQEAKNIQNLHERNALVTETIATSNLLVDEDVPADRVAAYLGDVRERHDGTHNVHVIDVEERVVETSTDGNLTGTSFDDAFTAWSRMESSEVNGTDGEFTGPAEATFLGEYTDPNNEFVIGYAAPIAAGDGDGGQSNRLVVLVVGLEAFGEELVASDGHLSYLINPSNNRILMDPTGESLWHGYHHGGALIEDASSHSMGVPDESVAASIAAANPGEGYENGEYIVSYAELPGETNWYIVYHTPQEETLGFVHTVQRWGTYASVAGIFVVVAIGGVIGRNTSTSINRLRGKAAEMGEGDLDVQFETHRIDSIGQLYDEFASMRDSLKAQMETAESAREEAERARAETESVNRELEAKAEEYRDVMRTCADGDFTTRMDPETDNDSMREIATEFNEMIAEIELTTAQLKAFATDVAAASEQVTAGSESVRAASEQVTGSIQEISDGAEQQHGSLQAVNQEMASLSTTTEEIAASSNEVATLASQTAETGDRGRDAAQNAIEGMTEIEDESQSAVEAIERLEAEIAQIDELLEFITEVAGQTNMLALNANIEATRSDSSNDGFSVVAGEVKELAEETKETAEDIEERLEGIKAETARTSEEVQRTSERVSEHVTSVERAVDALEEIAGYAEETNDGVQEISAASEEQAASTDEVVSMVDDAVTISEETTSEAQNVAAAAEEQTSSLIQVTRSTSDLSDQAVQLAEALDRFDTDVDVDDAAGETPLSLDDDAGDDAQAADDVDTSSSVVAAPAVPGDGGDGDDDTMAGDGSGVADDDIEDDEAADGDGAGTTSGDVFTFSDES